MGTLLTLTVLCLAIAELPGVRLLLALAILADLLAIGPLDAEGVTWAREGYPGILAPVLAAGALIAALLGSRPLRRSEERS